MISIQERFLVTLVEDGTLRVIKPKESLSSLSQKLRFSHVFTLKKAGKKAFFSIDTSLTGPQTIEKAKQSALVALDVRKRLLGKWGKDEVPKGSNFIAILVLGEVSHWEKKSRQVITKTIDYNLVVPDNVIIEAFKAFRKEFGEDFLNFINKAKLKEDNNVRRLIKKVIADNNGAIFYDLVDLKFKKICKIKDCLIVTDL